MKSTCKFTNVEDLAKNLETLLDELNKMGEFNIFLHQINDGGYRSMGIENGIPIKINSILNNGLSISKYASLCGTARLIGSSEGFNVDSILDYNYYNGHEDISICVIAIPKYIEINGEKVEFSSFNGKSNHDIDHDLRQLYADETKYIPDAHHRKCSLFDVVKGYKDLPKCYMLSVVNLNYVTDNFEVINPGTHLIFKGVNEFKNHKAGLAGHVVKIFEKYNIKIGKDKRDTQKQIATAIVNSYKEEENLRYEENLFDL